MTMTSDSFIHFCRDSVADYFNTHSDVTDNFEITPPEVGTSILDELE